MSKRIRSTIKSFAPDDRYAICSVRRPDESEDSTAEERFAIHDYDVVGFAVVEHEDEDGTIAEEIEPIALCVEHGCTFRLTDGFLGDDGGAMFARDPKTREEIVRELKERADRDYDERRRQEAEAASVVTRATRVRGSSSEA